MFASSAIPITVHHLSKKSDSMTDAITAIAVAHPRALQNEKLKSPTSAKSGDCTTLLGIDAVPLVRMSVDAIELITIATIVEATMPISSAPRTLRAINVPETTRPNANTTVPHVVRSPRPTGGGDGGAVGLTP